MVPCDIDMRRHMVPCDIDMRRHMVPCDIDMRRHMVPCDIDMRRHMVPCDIDMRRHMVPCDIDMRRHMVPCDIDMRRHMVPCDIDMRRHMVPCDIDMRRHMVPCDIDMRRHMVPCDIDMRRHMVPCDIDMRRHMVPCDIDMRRHMVPCDIDMRRHMVPCDIDMRRHMVPCDIDLRRHMVPCDIDMRRHMVPCDIDMRRHMVPCDIDMRRHMYEDCSFMVLAMTDSDVRLRLAKIYGMVKDKIKQVTGRLEATIGLALDTNWKIAALNYLEQNVLGNCLKMLERGRALFKNPGPNVASKGKQFQKDSETEGICLLNGGSLKVQPGVTPKGDDLNFLVSMFTADEIAHPWHRKPLPGSEVEELTREVSQAAVPLIRLSDLQTKSTLSVAQKSRLMDYAALRGLGVKFSPVIGVNTEELVITDFDSLAAIIDHILLTPAPRSCDLRCLGDAIPCWTEDDLLKVLPGATQSSKTLVLSLLRDKGLLLKFSTDPWCTVRDVSFVYIRFSDVPMKAPDILSQYWPPKKDISTSMQQREKFYFCVPGLPQSFFPTLLRYGSPPATVILPHIVQVWFPACHSHSFPHCSGMVPGLPQSFFPTLLTYGSRPDTVILPHTAQVWFPACHSHSSPHCSGMVPGLPQSFFPTLLRYGSRTATVILPHTAQVWFPACHSHSSPHCSGMVPSLPQSFFPKLLRYGSQPATVILPNTVQVWFPACHSHSSPHCSGMVPGLPQSFFPTLLRYGSRPATVILPLHFSGMVPGLPQSFFPTLLRELMRYGTPSIAWQKGAIFQKGHITVSVQLLSDGKDQFPVLVLQVRGNRGNPAFSDEPLWTTLKLYANTCDLLFLKFNISLMKCVHCSTCSQTSSVVEMLSKGSGAAQYFMEHLVRVGDNKDITCGVCGTQAHRDSQLGPAIAATELVPSHDPQGCAKATSNALNRCLMCNNCAVEGTHCEVNLTRGAKNWHCDCNRSAKLCIYCGMCQRCFLAIKNTAAELEPKFDPPKSERYRQDQLAALDKVKVTESGSIYGFIEADSSIALETKQLTPNYAPNMMITIVKDGYFILNLQTLAKEGLSRLEIEYFSKTGVVSERGIIVHTNRDGTPLKRVLAKLGDTLSVQLRYCEEERPAVEKKSETGGAVTVNRYGHMMLRLLLNGAPIYERGMRATQISVTLYNNDSEGVFLQVETPGKFPVMKRESKEKHCGMSAAQLPCSLQMKLIQMIENMEYVLFGGKGLSLSGSPCAVLPAHITMETLKHPIWFMVKDTRLHHMCLSWNAVQGKKSVLGSSISKDANLNAPMSDRLTKEDWTLSKIVHLVNAEGIDISKLPSGHTPDTMNFLIFLWHFVLSTYPEVLLPRSTDKLLRPVVLTPETDLQVKEGLRSLIQACMWHHYTLINFEDTKKTFQTSTQAGKFRGEFLTTRNILVQSSMDSQDLLRDHFECTGLIKVNSKFNRSLELYLCSSHSNALKMKESATEFPTQLTGINSVFLSFIDMSFNDLTSIPEEFFANLPNLTTFSIGHNFIENLPGSISRCKKLSSLSIFENNISSFPDELAELKNLLILDAGNNCLVDFPVVITKIPSLQKLFLNNCFFTELPEDIGNLKNLRQLHFQGNCLTRLPESFKQLSELEDLILSGVQWMQLGEGKDHITLSNFKHTIRRKFGRWLVANDQNETRLFKMFDENQNSMLEAKELGRLDAAVFNLFPRFGYKGNDHPDEDTPHGFPMELLACKKLRCLYFKYQAFTKIPPEICELENLVDLQVSHNPNLLSIPADLSKIQGLKKLELDDLPLLKTPPREIREKGVQSVMAYLQRLMSGAELSKRTKLMLVGLGGAGKTSLVKALMSSDHKMDTGQGHDVTDGIEIKTWDVAHGDEGITYNIWDFAGQTVYYNTHQFFLSPNRSIYLLLWNVRQGHEHAGLDFWLSSITVQAPKAPVFVIGSHIDEEEREKE
ncbi:hypothetical protein DPMN_151251 [Dreissena polymorpha]|uniref:Roc domain-containing protein n=1 Tax=Dreissena polymorpha TaxID=45954 RepID=A0A9D4FJ59_DREPO|nr:hypothetical protein DPMN_151251 [Dreissena polymorpha]